MPAFFGHQEDIGHQKSRGEGLERIENGVYKIICPHGDNGGIINQNRAGNVEYKVRECTPHYYTEQGVLRIWEAPHFEKRHMRTIRK